MNIPSRWENILDPSDVIDLGDAKVGLQKWFSLGDAGLANIELVSDVSRPTEQRAMFCMSVVTVDDDMKVVSYVPEGWKPGKPIQAKVEPKSERTLTAETLSNFDRYGYSSGTYPYSYSSSTAFVPVNSGRGTTTIR